ncbi:MAG: cysteine--tRNA ligase [Firmicutes bacterium]|nr:cysteine--tRNA ligase [Bacillota bacterium]
MKLYNTLTKRKENFYPIDNNQIKIYACGPTVYDFIHIGNARPLCVFDVLRRYLIYRGYNVKFVQNFTDIDDKIINRAKKEGVNFLKVSEKFIKEYETDTNGLNIKIADVHPKATETIDEIISMIEILKKNGYAYQNYDDIYFNSTSFSEYGKLSGQLLKELIIGARVEPSEKKLHPLDFVLWKSSKKDEPSWESPWGPGRPGWHIECSAMVKKYLGKTIDIHCGGQDLIFPHHENEIAQSECANKCQLSRFWLHNGFVNINDQKMSKSLNNFLTIREASKKYGYKLIRYLMISSHYRSPLNFSESIMDQCSNSMKRLSNFKRNLEFLKVHKISEASCKIIENLDEIREKFIESMDDDMNTSGALSVIFDLVKDVNNKISSCKNFSIDSVISVIEIFDELTDVLGFNFNDNKNQEISYEIKKLIEERDLARKNKEWEKSDSIRKILKEKNILVEDTKDGTKISENT